jgi:hypothetical protein
MVEGLVDAGIDTRVSMQLGHVDLTRVFVPRLNSADSRVLRSCPAKMLREADAFETPTAQSGSAM